MKIFFPILFSAFLCACGGGSSGGTSSASTSSTTVIDTSVKLTLSQTLDNYFSLNDINATDAGFALLVKENDKVV